MKAVLFFCVTAMTLSAGAFGLDSHYGSVGQSGANYTCTFKNNTGHALDMKYVVFSVSATGDDNGRDVQERIDQVVHNGNSVQASANILGAYLVHSCHFLSR
jgi:hypothetical protein